MGWPVLACSHLMVTAPPPNPEQDGEGNLKGGPQPLGVTRM